MAAKKFLRQVAGVITEIVATISSAGAANDGDIVALDANGKIAANMMPVGIAADIKNMVTSEDLVAGDLVNIYNNAGTLTARKADASAAGKEAHGFVIAAVTSPAAADIYFEGTNTFCTGLTVGSEQYLSATTPGKSTDTPPSGASQVVQRVGKALAATELSFEPAQPIQLSA